MILSLTIITLLFIFTYLPQVALLAIFQGHLAWFNAAVLVLGEGAAITAILFEAFLVDETLVDVFDAVCETPTAVAQRPNPSPPSYQNTHREHY